MVHLTSPAIAASGAYQRWAASLPGQQVLGGPEASPSRPGAGLGFQASACTLAKLHAISPQLFPLPAFCSVRGPSPNGVDAIQSSDPVTGTNAAAQEQTSPRNKASPAVSGPTGSEGAEARLLLRIDGSAGRPATISDVACPANLDAGGTVCIPLACLLPPAPISLHGAGFADLVTPLARAHRFNNQSACRGGTCEATCRRPGSGCPRSGHGVISAGVGRRTGHLSILCTGAQRSMVPGVAPAVPATIAGIRSATDVA